MTPYTLIRAPRKTIGIRITKDARVLVRAPRHLSQAEIDRVIYEKQGWINRHLESMARNIREQVAFTLGYGSVVYLLGEPYTITARKDHSGFNDACFDLPPGLSPDRILQLLILAYKMEARALIYDLTEFYACRMSLSPAAVKISGAKTRWGSCSSRRNLNFSWRLMMAQRDVIEYVVVHELAHLREFNHSVRFWAMVGEILPDYPSRKAKLRQLQQRLAKECWT